LFERDAFFGCRNQSATHEMLPPVVSWAPLAPDIAFQSEELAIIVVHAKSEASEKNAQIAGRTRQCLPVESSVGQWQQKAQTVRVAFDQLLCALASWMAWADYVEAPDVHHPRCLMEERHKDASG